MEIKGFFKSLLGALHSRMHAVDETAETVGRIQPEQKIGFLRKKTGESDHGSDRTVTSVNHCSVGRQASLSPSKSMGGYGDELVNAALPAKPEFVPGQSIPRASAALPSMRLADGFGDSKTLLNSRGWLQKAVEAKGARIVGGGCGCGQADIDIVLEGHKFNISIRPA